MNAIPTVTFAPNGFDFPSVGGEFAVNSTTAGSQSLPAIAALDNGGFVATWLDSGRIRARIFDETGSPIGADFFASSSSTTQFESTVMALPGGGFVVSWNENDGGQWAVRARIFETDGDPVGGEFPVSAANLAAAGHPSVDALPSGGFVVTWHESGGGGADTDGSTVKGRLFNASGTAVGGEFPINAVASGAQGNPSVLVLQSGGFVVAWVDNSGAGGDLDRLGVKARMFDASGTPVSGEFLINTATKHDQSGIELAALSSGGFVAVWQDDSGGSAITGPAGVKAQIFDAAGNPLGAEFTVDEAIDGDAVRAKVIALPSGGFVVAWEDELPGGVSGHGVKARIFDGVGNPVGGEFLLNTTIAGFQLEPAIALLESGGFAAVWLDSSGGSDDITGRLFGPPLSFAAIEQVALDLKGAIAVDDSDAGGSTITVTLSVDYGVLDVGAGGSGASVGGSGTGIVTITGTLAQIQSLLGGDATSTIVFTADTETPPASAALTVRVDDGVGGVGEENVTVTIQAIEHGTSGDDTLNGQSAALWLSAGAGNDVYVVDGDDDVLEASGEGHDIVYAIADHGLTIGQHVELLSAYSIAWTSALDLSGNERDNAIAGTFGANILNGGAGQDYLNGFAGDDILFGGLGADILDAGDGEDRLEGGAGNDLLSSGAGADLMLGGIGDDSFLADGGDSVFEGGGEGFDIVYALEDHVLTAGQHVDVLSAFSIANQGALNLTGNELDNVVAGTVGVNVLDGGGGNDQLYGFAGDDALRGGAGNDRLFGGEGTDQLEGGADDDLLDGGADNDIMLGGAGNDVYYAETGDSVVEAANEGTDLVYVLGDYVLAAGSHVEILSSVSIANQSALSLTGNELVNTLAGTNAADVLDGKGGSDWLVGFGGADSFRFTTALNGASNVDVIQDFLSGTDTIALDDAMFAGLSPGALPAGAFVAGTAAGDADDRIIYDQATGRIFFDADGNGAGAQVLFATLFDKPALAASDFTVI